MSDYIRYQLNNSDDCYFLTIVTKRRKHHFSSIDAKRNVWRAWNNFSKKSNGELLAYVILPDHIHVVIRQGELSFSRWVETTKRQLNYFLKPELKTLWQPHFWEHRIRDENDMIHAVEYVHYNPVKHGFSLSPFEYKASSFRSFVEKGLYPEDWSDSRDDEELDNHFKE
ncbi:MAG: transposase [Candidatus Electryonea clarkiae]|nr:transposase [Candidatus Electryonea clarkiae]MDP8286086.1 transposase [Candidatus Electryonea clarkiae]